MTPDFLRAVQACCQEKDLLMLLDEVQCGLGRTGELCGWKSIIPGDEIIPDAVSWAKSIGSGFPLGSFWIRDRELGHGLDGKLCDLLGPGSHGSTYGGSPLACTAALATLNVILRDDLTAKSAKLGQQIAEAVTAWQHPLIREVRAFGMLIGFELTEEVIAAKPEVKASGKIVSIYTAKALLDAGMMVVPAGPKVIRWLPPMNLTQAQASEGLALFKTVLDQLLEA
jgi:acetylornithine/succinyldiaminopimelate/putrescine aminotransferase